MKVVFYCIITSVFLFSSEIFAQYPANIDSSLINILNGIKGTPLELKQAVDYALKNATSVRKAEAVYLAAGGSLRRERGRFDPELFFNINYLNQDQLTASFFSGAPVLSTQQTTSKTGLRMYLPIGTELQISMNTTSLSSNSALAFLNPEYDVYGSISIRQPLLNGFSASSRKYLSQSEQQLEAFKARYDQEVVNVSANVEQMYWDLYAAERDFAVQQLTRDRANEFLKETELRAHAGLVGPNQVASAKTFLAEQELLLLEQRAQFDRRSERISSFIGSRPNTDARRFIPADEPSVNYPPIQIELLVNHVKQSNLDIIASKKDLETANFLANAAGWEALPQVNLIGSIGGSGLAGAGREVIILNDTLPVPKTSRLTDALNQTFKRDYPNWSLGLEISVPIGLRTGLGEKDRLEALVLDAEQNVVEKSRAIEEQVRNTYQELEDGKSRLDFARQEVDAAQEQVRIGMIEFHNGRSTAFELVRLGEDLARAQQQYSNALIRTAKAAATMKQLTSGWYPEHY